MQKPTCAVGGMLDGGRAICGKVIVGGVYCGHNGACQHKQECGHPRAKCVYDSDDGEYEKWQCPDCGKRWGVEIAQ